MYLHEEGEYSPIIVFTYNRPEHLSKTILSLKKNDGANFSDLFIYSDGPKDSQDEILIKQLRINLRKITGFKTITIIERPINFGLSRSLIQGVSEVLTRYDRAIILEDDMITSPYFLGFMNQALTKYEKNQNVACVHGYVYPGLKASPDTFFLRGADCWGWGTWRESWKLFNPDGKFLLNELRRLKVIE
jgi:GT2 family glycosyltransferase